MGVGGGGMGGAQEEQQQLEKQHHEDFIQLIKHVQGTMKKYTL